MLGAGCVETPTGRGLRSAPPLPPPPPSEEVDLHSEVRLCLVCVACSLVCFVCVLVGLLSVGFVCWFVVGLFVRVCLYVGVSYPLVAFLVCSLVGRAVCGFVSCV